MADRPPVRRALISVSDKRGVEGFARQLAQMGIELVSTGGTHRALSDAGIAVREVSELTGFPEMMDGRVKTLHPRVHGGLLALRDVEAHVEAMREHEIEPIDLVAVNLYPFESTVARQGASRDEAIEQIDIGGPSMIRSAAKNHRFVGVVVDPDDYGRVLEDLQRHDGRLSEGFARELAVKAFAQTARYDTFISRWLFDSDRVEGTTKASFPPGFGIGGVKALDLRYGENPHQRAVFYRSIESARVAEATIASAEVLSGKALSYNNIVDLDAALMLAKEFAEPFVCVCKHNNPCGAAVAETAERALAAAWAGDPVSAFGSVLAFTRPVDAGSADFLVSENRFVEAIVAPGFDADALETLTTRPRWGKSVRLLACGEVEPARRDPGRPEVKPIAGGFLVQSRDLSASTSGDCESRTVVEPSPEQLASLLFAERIAKHVKSNAIVLARGSQVVGIGAGQMSRVDAVRIAIEKAGKRADGAVLASDAFFPFPDGVQLAMDAGVSAILQPGGSVRDAEVIAACDARGVPMVFTGRRHFRH